MRIAFVGAGRVGTALAVLLQRSGHQIVALSGRAGTRERAAEFLPGVPVVASAEAVRQAEVVIVGTPDGAIPEAAAEIAAALQPGAAVVHLSGASGLEALDVLAGTGARRLAVHPLQSFPTVELGIERFPGSAAAVTAEDEEGFTLGERLATDAGGRPFRLPNEARPLYHAAAVFAANYLAVVTLVAERLFRAAGVDEPVDRFMPLSKAVLDNVGELGAAAALTGPAARGETETVARNLDAVRHAAPEAVEAYVALARLAGAVAEDAGRLPAADRAALEEVLAAWR